MKPAEGVIREITLGTDGVRQALIQCSPAVVPRPGQYLAAVNRNEPEADLVVVLHPAGRNSDPEKVQLAPLPRNWRIGDRVCLRGPLGKGFNLHHQGYRLGLISLSGSVEWLLPAIHNLLEKDNQVTFIGDADLHGLPLAVEAYPLDSWEEQLSWVDEILLECPMGMLSDLRERLGVDIDFAFPVPVQVLLRGAMPCLGLADCGVCAVRTMDDDYLLTCSDGPVFDLHTLKW